MATGEGKTITALMPAVTAAMARMPVHVFTVNDYLATRHADKLTTVYPRFRLTVGLVVNGKESDARRADYRADVVYGANKQINLNYMSEQSSPGPEHGAPRPDDMS